MITVNLNGVFFSSSKIEEKNDDNPLTLFSRELELVYLEINFGKTAWDLRSFNYSFCNNTPQRILQNSKALSLG